MPKVSGIGLNTPLRKITETMLWVLTSPIMDKAGQRPVNKRFWKLTKESVNEQQKPLILNLLQTIN